MNEKSYEERLLDNMTRIVNSLGDGGSYDNPDETTYEGKMLNRTDKIADILENGGGGGGGALILHTVEDDEYTYLDKTAAEIIAAMPLVYVELEAPLEGGGTGHGFLGICVGDIMGYTEIDGVYFFIVRNDSTYSAESLNERPKSRKSD